MDVNDIIKAVEESVEFKSIDTDHYLVHIFRMMGPDKSEDCQIGYYSKKADKIIVFDFIEGKVKATPPQEAFKEKNYIAALDLSKVKVSMDEALTTAQDVVKSNYPAHLLSKAIVLLQKLPEFGQIWNITVITHTFQVINIKIDADTGKTIKHSMESLLGWKKE